MSTDAAGPLDPRPSAIEWTALAECAVDPIRNGLRSDVLRRRGNNDLEHIVGDVPHVLGFAFEPEMDGRTLPRPVNCGLVRILPPAGVVIDEAARPFMAVDPAPDAVPVSSECGDRRLRFINLSRAEAL